ncbi:hypothetical protein F3Y22_tig00110259pilonHSYRG00009 [Hibiscus syriacus]|uniref:Leucine-rich repeat-containing N-terminal plant-type domain-containing protein n=1 Tax=Hibiscus syriacus TaxID=106335 RepID=A0A6A3B625_HIBSY|nr:hypothetical protein F3Y22_tig00110259pilonHSYRG00009 [Hibiscus syriacus]
MTTMGFVRKNSQQPSPSPSSFITLSGVLGKPPGLRMLFLQAKRYPHLHLLPFFPHSFYYKKRLESCEDGDEKRRMPIVPLPVVELSPPAPCCVSALVAVKKQLLDPLNHLRNWNRGDPCTSNWTGIECSDHPGNDGYFMLRSSTEYEFSGTLVPELGQLSRLIIVEYTLGDRTNFYLGTPTLEWKQLNSSLPDELGYLSKLNRFQIDENNLSGQIPKAYANLSSGNIFTSKIHSVAKFPLLEYPVCFTCKII